MIQESFRWTGIWAVLICALDYNFLLCCDARPDVMCAALGIWAIALRNEWLAAAACLVHPVGWFYAVLLMFLKQNQLIMFKYRSVGISTCANLHMHWQRTSYLPYLLAILVCVLYISQAPYIWVRQMVGQYVEHTCHMSDVDGQMVFLGFGTGWRLVVLAVYLACAWLTVRRNKNLVLWLLVIIAPVLLLAQTTYYFPHVIPLFALCVAIQMRKYPWLALILIPLAAFAITSLFPLWDWNGVMSLG